MLDAFASSISYTNRPPRDGVASNANKSNDMNTEILTLMLDEVVLPSYHGCRKADYHRISHILTPSYLCWRKPPWICGYEYEQVDFKWPLSFFSAAFHTMNTNMVIIRQVIRYGTNFTTPSTPARLYNLTETSDAMIASDSRMGFFSALYNINIMCSAARALENVLQQWSGVVSGLQLTSRKGQPSRKGSLISWKNFSSQMIVCWAHYETAILWQDYRLWFISLNFFKLFFFGKQTIRFRWINLLSNEKPICIIISMLLQIEHYQCPSELENRAHPYLESHFDSAVPALPAPTTESIENLGDGRKHWRVKNYSDSAILELGGMMTT